MKRHLSSQEISLWMSGDRTPRRELHVYSCATCLAELERVDASFALFRGAVTHWAAEQAELEPFTMKKHRRGFVAWELRWTAIAGLAILLAGIPIYRQKEQARHEAAMRKLDAALLEQVDAELSRFIPEPLEPLTKLVAWNSGSKRESDATGVAGRTTSR